MQRRQLWVMNAALAGFAILMAVRLAGAWKGGNERFTRLAERSRAAGVLPMVPASQPPPAATGEVVAKNLFSPDRNNERPQETRVQSQPPLPIVIGTMRLGGTYEALMAEAGVPGANRFRRVQQGELVGSYTVVEIRDEAVVVEFQGQKSSINVYQSAQSVARAAPPPPPPAAAASPVVESSGSASAAAAALPAGTTQASSGASPGVAPPLEVKVTIEGNRKRFERYTAFGPQVWYEDITK